MSIRLAATFAAAALLCACSGPKATTSGASASSPPTAAPGGANVAVSAGPANAPASRAGKTGGIPLDPAQRAELQATISKTPAALRARLRYALAAGDDGRRRLVVYDGEGLDAAGRQPGKGHAYVMFKVLNSATNEHYDPQENRIVAPIPPAPERGSSLPSPNVR
jgi:hypothetical protein